MKDGETFSDRFFDFSEDDCSRQEKSTTMVMQFSIGGGGGGGAVGSISAVSRVRSLIFPEETFRGMSAVSFSRTAAGNRA